MAVKNTDRMLDLSRDLLASGVPKYGVGGRRNLIINGAMQVAQRGTQETGITSTGYYTVDRFRFARMYGTWTMDQNTVTDLPGFTKSAKITCTATGTGTGTQNINFSTRLEAQNLQHLKKGTSDAESVTLSFWVRSGVTGTYSFEIYEGDNARSIGATFTIDTADTWEYKTITFPGDTTGAIANDNGIGFFVSWFLDTGPDNKTGTHNTSWNAHSDANRLSANQVNLASGNDSAVNYFEITGVQLEVGDTATPFEHRSYAEELALCYRYYQRYSTTSGTSPLFTGVATNGTQLKVSITPYGGPMRIKPAVTLPGAAAGNQLAKGNGTSSNITAVSLANQGGMGPTYDFTSSGLTANHIYYVTGAVGSGAALELDAEL